MNVSEEEPYKKIQTLELNTHYSNLELTETTTNNKDKNYYQNNRLNEKTSGNICF